MGRQHSFAVTLALPVSSDGPARGTRETRAEDFLVAATRQIARELRFRFILIE